MHRANAEFWKEYWALPAAVRKQADKQFALLRTNPRHPSLQFKRLAERGGQELWSVRVTLKYRALAVRIGDEYVWFWIGEHDILRGDDLSVRAGESRTEACFQMLSDVVFPSYVLANLP